MASTSYPVAVLNGALPDKVQEFQGDPLVRQLGFLFGREVRVSDVESELRSNEVYPKDAEFFLGPHELEEFRETRRRIEEAKARGLPIWRIPANLLVKDKMALDSIRKKKHELLRMALEALYSKELERILSDYSRDRALSDQKLTYGEAEKRLASLDENLPNAIAVGCARAVAVAVIAIVVAGIAITRRKKV